MEKDSGYQDEDQLNWDALRNGDAEAFTALYNSYSKLLLSYGRKVHNDRQLVADSVQELFTYLWRRRNHLGDTASVKYYLIKALRTIIVKEINRKNFHQLNLAENKIAVYSSREDQIITEEYNMERKESIKEAIKNLSKREQEILHLKYFARLSNEEIAFLLDIKYQSVKNVAVRAIKKLKKHLVILQFFLIGNYLHFLNPNVSS